MHRELNTSTNPLQIGAVTLKTPTALAPMEGVTDRAFRRLIRGVGGCGLTVTEFVSSEGISRDDRRAWANAELDPDEHPVSIQIYGRNPEKLARAAQRCAALGADMIDLNLGCPSKAVTSGCAGSALMREPARAAEIFAAVFEAIEVPMTVKMRLGWDDDRRNAPEIASLAVQAGAELITVHGRTRQQLYRGQADWAALREVKAAIGERPLLVNGDILTAEDARLALELSGAQGVMIGRGALRDPWVFRRVSAALAGQAFEEPSLTERRTLLVRYFDQLQRDAKSERHAIGRIKKITGLFARGLPYCDQLREEIFPQQQLAPIYDALQRWFDRLERESIDDGFLRLHGARRVDEELDQREARYAVFDRGASVAT